MIIKHHVSYAIYVLSTQFRSKQMHAHWESCNQSVLWSMESEKIVLADTINVVTTIHTVSYDELFDWVNQLNLIHVVTNQRSEINT